MTQVKGTVPASSACSSTVLVPWARSTFRARSGTRMDALQSNCEVASTTHRVGSPA